MKHELIVALADVLDIDLRDLQELDDEQALQVLEQIQQQHILAI